MLLPPRPLHSLCRGLDTVGPDVSFYGIDASVETPPPPPGLSPCLPPHGIRKLRAPSAVVVLVVGIGIAVVVVALVRARGLNYCPADGPYPIVLLLPEAATARCWYVVCYMHFKSRQDENLSRNIVFLKRIRAILSTSTTRCWTGVRSRLSWDRDQHPVVPRTRD